MTDQEKSISIQVRELLTYIDYMQTVAVRLQSFADVLSHLHFEDACPGGRVVLADEIAKVAAELTAGLDTVNLPAVETSNA